jgi:hypothetical protein
MHFSSLYFGRIRKVSIPPAPSEPSDYIIVVCYTTIKFDLFIYVIEHLRDDGLQGGVSSIMEWKKRGGGEISLTHD